jgi:hypothetical protein
MAPYRIPGVAIKVGGALPSAWTALAGMAVVAADAAFNFIFAPLILLAIFLVVAVAEVYTEYRILTPRQRHRFPLADHAFGKLALVALIVAAMGLDAAMYVIARATPNLFPLLSQVEAPVVTLVWTLWLIVAQGMRIRKNVVTSEGADYSPPLAGPAFDAIDNLRARDRERAGGELPNRRWTDLEAEGASAATQDEERRE